MPANRHWNRDLYADLGVVSDASDEAIKKAYRKLARDTHPDFHPELEERFKLVSNAYEVLSDPNSRRAYDEHRSLTGQRSTASASAEQTSQAETSQTASGRPRADNTNRGSDNGFGSSRTNPLNTEDLLRSFFGPGFFGQQTAPNGAYAPFSTGAHQAGRPVTRPAESVDRHNSGQHEAGSFTYNFRAIAGLLAKDYLRASAMELAAVGLSSYVDSAEIHRSLRVSPSVRGYDSFVAGSTADAAGKAFYWEAVAQRIEAGEMPYLQSYSAIDSRFVGRQADVAFLEFSELALNDRMQRGSNTASKQLHDLGKEYFLAARDTISKIPPYVRRLLDADFGDPSVFLQPSQAVIVAAAGLSADEATVRRLVEVAKDFKQMMSLLAETENDLLLSSTGITPLRNVPLRVYSSLYHSAQSLSQDAAALSPYIQFQPANTFSQRYAEAANNGFRMGSNDYRQLFPYNETAAGYTVELMALAVFDAARAQPLNSHHAPLMDLGRHLSSAARSNSGSRMSTRAISRALDATLTNSGADARRFVDAVAKPFGADRNRAARAVLAAVALMDLSTRSPYLGFSSNDAKFATCLAQVAMEEVRGLTLEAPSQTRSQATGSRQQWSSQSFTF